jgi:hypothetical protein
VHVIDHPDARVLVDTGMTELLPAVADLAHRLGPLSEQAFDLAGSDIVVNTRLHFEHEPRATPHRLADHAGALLASRVPRPTRCPRPLP